MGERPFSGQGRLLRGLSAEVNDDDDEDDGANHTQDDHHLEVFPPVFTLELGCTRFELGGPCLESVSAIIQL